MKRVGDGRTRVTGRGREDRRRGAIAESAQTPGEKTGTEILEGERGPMEQLQGVNSRLDFDLPDT